MMHHTLCAIRHTLYVDLFSIILVFFGVILISLHMYVIVCICVYACILYICVQVCATHANTHMCIKSRSYISHRWYVDPIFHYFSTLFGDFDLPGPPWGQMYRTTCGTYTYLCPKSIQKHPKGPPRESQGDPRGTQEGPKTTTNTKIRLQTRSRIITKRCGFGVPPNLKTRGVNKIRRPCRSL